MYKKSFLDITLTCWVWSWAKKRCWASTCATTTFRLWPRDGSSASR